MATVPTQFISNATIPTSTSAGQLGSYAVPTGYTDKLYEIIMCNTASGVVTVDLWSVPNGGSRTAATKLYDAQDLSFSPGETKQISLEQRLSAGAQIHGGASTGSVVSIHAAGDRVN